MSGSEWAQSFAFTAMFYLPSNILLVYPVRKRMRISIWWVLPAIAVETLATVLLRQIHWLANIPFLYLTMWLYCKVVDAPSYKLVYMNLVAVSYSVAMNILLFIIEGMSSYLWEWDALATMAAAYAVTLPPMLWFMERYVWAKLEAFTTPAWGAMWMIPAVFMAINLIVGSSHVQFLIDGPLSWAYNLCSILLVFATAGTCLLMLTMMEKHEEAIRRAADLTVVDMQMHTQARRFAEIAAQMEQVRVLRHDMRHHLTMMRLLMDNGEYEEADRYLSQYEGEVSAQDDVHFSQNFVGDLVARHSMLRGTSLGVDVDVKCALPADCWVQETDLCILLSNLMENAINAAELAPDGARWVVGRARQDGDEVLVTVENGYSPQKEAEKARQASAGRGRGAIAEGMGQRGLGIPSIKAVTAKYNGTAVFEAGDGGVFRARALLYRVQREAQGA